LPTSKIYELGSLVRTTAKFTKFDGSVQDPTTVSLTVTTPNGTETTYVYGTDNILKASTGIYYYLIDANAVGLWKRRWFSTGVGQAASSGKFEVIEGA